jgi:hypothetical protein
MVIMTNAQVIGAMCATHSNRKQKSVIIHNPQPHTVPGSLNKKGGGGEDSNFY